VPKKQGEQLLEDALGALCAALDEIRVTWMLIGGLATIARGVRRMTTDIDAVVQGDAIDIPSLLLALAEHQIVARATNAAEFAGENLVLLVTHQPTGIDLDISLGFTGFERQAIEHREVVSFGKLSVPMARAEDLVVFKAIAARTRRGKKQPGR
jgi:hypothetical protein